MISRSQQILIFWDRGSTTPTFVVRLHGNGRKSCMETSKKLPLNYLGEFPEKQKRTP